MSELKTVLVSIPADWPWDTMTYYHLGPISKEPRRIMLSPAEIDWLKAKGLNVEEVDDEPPARPARRKAE